MNLERALAPIALLMVLALVIGVAGQAMAAPRLAMVKVIIGFDTADPPAIENALVTVAGPGQPSRIAERRQVVEEVGGDVEHCYHLIPAVAAAMPRKAVDVLRKRAEVSFIEIDAKVWALEETLPWGIDRIEAELVHSYNKGQGVKVAVIDTGIDLDHPDLRVVGDVTFVSGTTSGDDDHGHGTHVAGIVAALDNDIGTIGVAPEADVYAVKVLDKNGSGYWSDVIEGIEWAVGNGMQVVNMSLGSRSGSTALEAACNSAFDSGVIVVSAAGNSGNSWGWGDNVLYPASYNSVIAVAATDSLDRRSRSRGPALTSTPPVAGAPTA